MKQIKKYLIPILVLIAGLIAYSLQPSNVVELPDEPEQTVVAELTGAETAQSVESQQQSAPPEAEGQMPEPAIAEDGSYTTKEDVSLYLYPYGHLPGNFITKADARALGWEGGSLEPYAPGKCIGGDRFGNLEKLLPTGASYHECDINTLGASARGAERLVYSDKCIYYTNDHYESFTLLYGEEAG